MIGTYKPGEHVLGSPKNRRADHNVDGAGKQQQGRRGRRNRREEQLVIQTRGLVHCTLHLSAVMVPAVLRFSVVLCVLLLPISSNAEKNNKKLLCIHPWVKVAPSNGDSRTTQFFPQEKLIAATQAFDPSVFEDSETKKIPFFEPVKPYCLYFKVADKTGLDEIYSNDVHHAILMKSDSFFDVLSFHHSVDAVCSKPGAEEVGIGHVVKINYKRRMEEHGRSEYVKVKWYCCQECAKTIDEIEMNMLTMLLPVNYLPKKTNFDGEVKNTTLRNRSVSPCYDIYGERYEFAVPHYDTPVCPVYAYFDFESPHYEFNHVMSRDRKALDQMWKTCLSDSRATNNTCFWDYKSLDGPIELKCCCREDLESCTYKLSNRRQNTRCFDFNGAIRPDKSLRLLEHREAYDSATADGCSLSLNLTENWTTEEITYKAQGEFDDIETKGRACLRMLRNKNVSVHCLVERDADLCPFQEKTNLSRSFTRHCCCQGDLCNLAYVRETMNGLEEISKDIKQRPPGMSVRAFAEENCPGNPDEYLYSAKGCVQYHLPGTNYEHLSLVESHNFHILDYVEYGKFTKCALLKVELSMKASSSDLLKIRARNNCKKQSRGMNADTMFNYPLYVLQCQCTDSQGEPCDLRERSDMVRAIDISTRCYAAHHLSEESENFIVNKTVFFADFTEPSYCSVMAFGNQNGHMFKHMIGFNQTQLITQSDQNIDRHTSLRCSMQSLNGIAITTCSCQSGGLAPCNNEALLNKALNFNFGLHRVDASVTDESLECEMDDQRERCYQPGCFIVVERNETRSGCLYRHENLTSRRRCEATGMKNDCKVIVPHKEDGGEVHVLCCCEGLQCKSTEFIHKRQLRTADLKSVGKGHVVFLVLHGNSISIILPGAASIPSSSYYLSATSFILPDFTKCPSFPLHESGLSHVSAARDRQLLTLHPFLLDRSFQVLTTRTMSIASSISGDSFDSMDSSPSTGSIIESGAFIGLSNLSASSSECETAEDGDEEAASSAPEEQCSFGHSSAIENATKQNSEFVSEKSSVWTALDNKEVSCEPCEQIDVVTSLNELVSEESMGDGLNIEDLKSAEEDRDALRILEEVNSKLEEKMQELSLLRNSMTVQYKAIDAEIDSAEQCLKKFCDAVDSLTEIDPAKNCGTVYDRAELLERLSEAEYNELCAVREAFHQLKSVVDSVQEMRCGMDGLFEEVFSGGLSVNVNLLVKNISNLEKDLNERC
uniref:Protein sleepless n=1 Tax=Steinernema glaseri TaxID=37863 RepID=A0A1I7YNU9_9BILA